MLIYSSNETDKAAHNFSAFIALAHPMYYKNTTSSHKYDIPGSRKPVSSVLKPITNLHLNLEIHVSKSDSSWKKDQLKSVMRV
jgi:hypothetical protein